MKRAERRDVVAEITSQVVEALESGSAPWVRPWRSTGSGAMPMPRNGRTDREYRGVNVVVLWAVAFGRGYADPRWVTFNQARELGGSVRRRERGTQIVFWKFVDRKDAETGEARRIPFARAYTVFNVEQCEGLSLDALPAAERTANPGTVADDLAVSAGARVVRGGDRAFYSPSADTVRVPSVEAFESESTYASTLLHELAHWTGHESRLGRKFGSRFGDDAYAFEELVAEMSAAFLCARLGVEGRLQHVEYLGHWARVLRADKHAVFTAAREAQRVADMLQPIDAISEAA